MLASYQEWVIDNLLTTDELAYQRQHEYARYLESQRWRTLARAVRMRAKGKCEICLRADGEECAHLTYERIFHERITEAYPIVKTKKSENEDSLLYV
jgi:hypothetical protein